MKKELKSNKYIYIYIYFIPLGYDYFIITKICKLMHSFML